MLILKVLILARAKLFYDISFKISKVTEQFKQTIFSIQAGDRNKLSLGPASRKPRNIMPRVSLELENLFFFATYYAYPTFFLCDYE